MNLTKEQITQFDKDGYLFFPDLFSKEEVQIFQPKFLNYMTLEKNIIIEKKVVI